MADLFISYARNDAPQVEALAAILERAGWSVWWDRRITTGSSFDLVIEQALAEAKAVIVAWSRHSVGSEWVRAEAAFAVEKKKLVPVRLDDTIPPLRFTNIQTVDLSAWDHSGASAPFRRLIADLTQLIGAPPEAGKLPLEPGPAAAAPSSARGPAEPHEIKTPPAAKPARRVSRVVMALAAVAVVAAAGAFLALRGGTERTAFKTEATPTQTSAASPPAAPEKEAARPAAPVVAAPNPAAPPPATAEASATAAPPAKSEAPIAAPAAPAPALPTAAPAAAPTGTSDREVELAFWKSIKDSSIAADFEAYLEKYPNGDFAAVARNRLAAMKAAQTAAVAPPAKAAPAPAPAPELEVIDNYMVAARAAPMREAPDITAKQVGRLKDGERVHVAGKVKGGEWYAVELKGDSLAYVATVALEDSEVYQARKEKEREREKELQEKEQEAQQQQAVKTAMAPKALAPAPAAAPAAPKPSGVGAYNGTWRGTMSCEASSYGPAFKSDVRPFTVADGHVSGDYDVPGYGTGGHEVYSGKVDADGNFTVTGQGENGKVGKYPIEFSGKITDATLVADGRMGFRHCKISYRR